jgi:hypothetical protein
MGGNRVPDQDLGWTTNERKKGERPRIRCMKEICDEIAKEELEKLKYVHRK